jgi:hypothetical protein
MKQCPKCNLKKDLSEFNKNQKRKDGLQRICKICSRNEDKKSYKKSKEYNPRIRLDRNKEVFNRKIKWINTFKEEGCIKCGEKRCHVLDFHHLDPSKKEFNIASYASYEKLKKEIKKCIILCSNCHRDFHYLERNNKITIKEYLHKVRSRMDASCN